MQATVLGKSTSPSARFIVAFAWKELFFATVAAAIGCFLYFLGGRYGAGDTGPFYSLFPFAAAMCLIVHAAVKIAPFFIVVDAPVPVRWDLVVNFGIAATLFFGGSAFAYAEATSGGGYLAAIACLWCGVGAIVLGIGRVLRPSGATLLISSSIVSTLLMLSALASQTIVLTVVLQTIALSIMVYSLSMVLERDENGRLKLTERIED